MKITHLAPSRLLPAAYNPRQIGKKAYSDLKADIAQHGILQPIVVNMYPSREYTVISGHQRRQVAIDLGIKQVPCYFVKFTEQQEKEVNIKQNKLGGKWDMDKLANWYEAEDLQEWGFSQVQLGFNIDKLPLTCECCGQTKK